MKHPCPTRCGTCHPCIKIATDPCYRALIEETPMPEGCLPKPVLTEGPGKELAAMLKDELAIQRCPKSKCKQWAQQMNDWGIAGCRANFEEIVSWLRESKSETDLGWGLIAALARVATKIIAWRLNPFDPIPGIVAEAIRRAEQRS